MGAHTVVRQGTAHENTPDEIKRGAARWLRKQVTILPILAVILFWSAGRVDWLWGWVQIILYALVIAAQALIFLPRDPALLAERSKLQAGTKRWDLVITGFAASLLPIVTWIVAGFDVRNGWTEPQPFIVHIVGVLGFLLGYALLIWAMASNTYFSATVRIQSERNHHVSTGGPYRYVRHPGYVGAIIFQMFTPLMLGSWWAFIPSVIIAVLYIVRTALEDRTLQAELDGYREFTQQVRYRLLPGVW